MPPLPQKSNFSSKVTSTNGKLKPQKIIASEGIFKRKAEAGVFNLRKVASVAKVRQPLWKGLTIPSSV